MTPHRPDDDRPPPPAARGGRATWICVALAVITVAVYAPVRGHEFVSFDDEAYVRANPHIAGGLTWEAVRWAFTSGYAANWHPLTWISHALDVSLFGMNAGAHHVVNLVLHVANTLLLFDVLRRATGALGRSAFVAALFAVHPLHVESVAWVAERKDVLSTLFWMLTLEAYVAWTRAPNARRYALVLLAFAAGLMSKPMLVTLPFALLLLDVWPLRRMTDAASAKRLVVEKIPLFLLAAASSVVTFLVQRAEGAVAGFEANPVGDRVANALISYVIYARNMFWPARLAAIYVQERPLPTWKGVAAAALLALVTILAVRGARRRPWFVVGWLWFLGTLVPVVGLVQVGMQSMADRYTYVPLVGLFVVVAWVATELADWERRRGAALPAAAVLATLACAVVARRQVETWKDSETLWRHAVDVEPDNAAAHNYLGDHLCWLGRWDEAVAEFREFVRISPDSAEARNNLGYALMKRGDFGAAEAALREALQRDSAFADAHENLGFTLRSQGRLDDAVVELNEALRLRPGFAAAHRDLAGVYAEQGRVGDAVREFETALRLDPDDQGARDGLARLTGGRH
jgi:tetratricopeptide (TPR) repeat protein